MKIPLLLLILLAIISTFATAQNTIKGTVCDDEGNPISNATIEIVALHISTASNDNGTFLIQNIPNGIIELKCSHFNFVTTSKIISTDSDMKIDFELKESPFEISPITVTAKPYPSFINQSSLSVTAISDKSLERLRGESLGKTIENIPGVNAFSGSEFSVKPVIRGLTAQRILVMEDGVKIESQTWDEPQSPEIDIFDVDQIDIVRGPLSVLYGSDAIGGVVNVHRQNIFSLPQSPLKGNATVNFSSNNPQAAGGVSLFGSLTDYFYRVHFSGRFLGDYTAPSGTLTNGENISAGTVANSGGYEYNGSLTLGKKSDWGTMQIDFRHFAQKYYISAEPGRKEYELNIHTGMYDSLNAAPSQEIYHEKVTVMIQSPLPFATLDITTTGQYNSRKEEGVKESEEDEQLKKEKGIKPEALLDLYTISLDAKAHHASIGILEGTVGVSAVFQRNQTLGMNAIIPNYTSSNFAGYIYDELPVTSYFRLIGGGRYDIRSLSVAANDSLKNLSKRLTYQPFSGSIGFSFNVAEQLTVALNFGTGWRSPVASELFTLGKDEGAIRYKIGNSSLVSERSRDIDVTVKYLSEIIHGEISIFKNFISNYIYLMPTGSTIEGLDAYTYSQADATLEGGEVSLETAFSRSLLFSTSADMVIGTNEFTKSPLPLIPAKRIQGGVRYTYHSDIYCSQSISLQNSFVEIHVRHTFEQNRVSIFETVSPSYTLIDLGIETDLITTFPIATINVGIENILNTGYYSQLSRYKEFALNPGRNFILKASIPFSILEL